MNITDFLLARIAEDEGVARRCETGPPIVRMLQVGMDHNEGVQSGWIEIDPGRVLAECEAKRRIVEWHKNWPVLVETPPTFAPASADDVGSMTVRMSQQIAWATEQEYRLKFGTEPPTGPIIRIIAAVYADHPDYREEWKP